MCAEAKSRRPAGPDSAAPTAGPDVTAAASAADATGPRPEMRLAGAIYGTILVMSVITAKSAIGPPDAGIALLAAAVTNFVFWLAHVYSDALAAHITLRTRRLDRRRLLDIAREEWPLVQSVLPPGACLILGIVGLVSDNTAVVLALCAGVVALAVWGSASARRGGASRAGMAIAATVNVAFGLMIVALKLLVH